MVGKNATDTSVLAKAMSTELLIIYIHYKNLIQAFGGQRYECIQCCIK